MQINSNRLRELRAARQWSQEQLASLVVYLLAFPHKGPTPAHAVPGVSAD